MIEFVNAKINIGLNVTGKREDGYHNLETVFFPIGIESGTPHQPDPFDDVMEVSYDRGKVSGCRFQFVGRRIDCPPRKNLVVRAASLILKRYNESFNDMADYGMFVITLNKHLPDGAGLGGGSADAAFTLKMLNDATGKRFGNDELKAMASEIGADCAFFIENRPCFAEGIGNILTPIELDLHGLTLLLVKPDIYVSTAEAFSGIKPQKPDYDLRFLPFLPLEEWRDKVVNDFEQTVFKVHPELGEIKNRLYESGANNASMSGSGSAIYGIYKNKDEAERERERLKSTYQGLWLFGL